MDALKHSNIKYDPHGLKITVVILVKSGVGPTQ